MTEAAAGGGRAEMQRRIVQRSLEDEDFRRRLLEDPKTTMQDLGVRVPDEVRLTVVEETPETFYVVIPGRSASAQAGDELSGRDLESVAGGDTNWTCGGWSCGPPSQCQSG